MAYRQNAWAPILARSITISQPRSAHSHAAAAISGRQIADAIKAARRVLVVIAARPGYCAVPAASLATGRSLIGQWNIDDTRPSAIDSHHIAA